MNQRLLALLQGRAAGAFAKDLRRWAARRALDKDKQKVVNDCIRYLVNNRKLLHYDRYIHPHGYESVSFASMGFYR